jgi:hypothetical protein
MQPLEVGKLYSCSEYFLMLYPDKESAAEGGPAFAAAPLSGHGFNAAYAAASAAAYWNRKLGKPVNSQTPLLVLSVNEKYVEVLAGDKRGWIINEDWLELKEIVNEAA